MVGTSLDSKMRLFQPLSFNNAISRLRKRTESSAIRMLKGVFRPFFFLAGFLASCMDITYPFCIPCMSPRAARICRERTTTEWATSPLTLYQPLFHHISHQLCDGFHPQLLHQTRPIGANRLRAQCQSICNFAHRLAIRQQKHYLELALRE